MVAFLNDIQREPTVCDQFMMNLSPQLESLFPKSHRKAKTEIQQVLYRYEFKDESDVSDK